MPALFTPDIFALVDADFSSTVGAEVEHCAGGRGRTAALARGSGIAFAIHVFVDLTFDVLGISGCREWWKRR